MAKITNQQFIIAIGASAGGLEAISAFFDYTPLDAVSYILIQHLSADFKSQMARILTPHSKLQVIEATNDVVIKPNTVYLIPSTKFMVIKDGKLVLSDKKGQQRPHMTIDCFFTSLAHECGDKAIGIVLSGTGTDGSEGIAAIKKAGGIAIVQDPDTADFNAMPLAAIATGCADSILSPQAMPQVIEEYVKDGTLKKTSAYKSSEINDDELEGILNLIKENLPLDFLDYKRPTIVRRIKRRMEQNNYNQAGQYVDYLKTNPEEIKLLANDFLIGVTSFFRDPEAYKIIEKEVIPDIVSRATDDAIKIWVAGCSTGQEAYSIAILVKEHLAKIEKPLEVKIFATDINKAALDFASKGIYPDSITKNVSEERLELFFTPAGDQYKVKHELRKMLIFAEHDLVKNPPYCNTDLICCRNLLIYLNPVLQKKVFSMLHFGLRKDGCLFLGPSENAAVIREDFNEVSGKWNIFKSHKTGRKIKFDAFSPHHVIEGVKAVPKTDKKLPPAVTKLSLADQINLTIMEESGFSGLCTDENLQVIQSFGDTSAYLRNENFNFNLTDLLPENVSITFKATAHQALNLDQKVKLNGLSFRGIKAPKNHMVNVVIKPFYLDGSDDKLLLVLFKEHVNSKAKENSVIKDADIYQLTKQHLISVERELAESKHQLSVATERIDASNENMQSFNEELQSANEEMQSANEEMQSTNEELQSVNEELQTVNKEHQITNTELTELNDDLNNYFRSNLNGQLFVDHELNLKKYSPGVVKHINIRDSDIGRPLSNITTNIKLDTLIDDIKKVIADDQTITKETASTDGRCYQIMTMPYIRKNTNKTDGAVISFYDITELKKISGELNKSNHSLLRINADLNNFVYGASHDLNAPISNIEMVLNILDAKLNHDDPEVAKLSGMMNKAISNFKGVIKDLAKVGKIEAEMLEESHNESFEDIFDEIKETLDSKIKLANATISANFREKKIRFPRKNLRSIILNLTTNALKFSSPGRPPEILLKTEKIDKYVLLSVKDNGIGVKKDRIDYIFKMYQRINDDMEGQGIGLYLIKKIVDASGGKIEVESEVGKGSTFNVFFKN